MFLTGSVSCPLASPSLFYKAASSPFFSFWLMPHTFLSCASRASFYELGLSRICQVAPMGPVGPEWCLLLRAGLRFLPAASVNLGLARSAETQRILVGAKASGLPGLLTWRGV